jgi:hypothetical protein
MLKQKDWLSMSSYFKLLKSILNDALWPAWHELFRSMPDSLFLGTALFSGITQNFPLGILVLAMLEISILQRLFGGFLGSIASNEADAPDAKCLPGIPSPYQLSLVSHILKLSAFPSGPVFFISAVLAYIIGSTVNFRTELKELAEKEPEWNARIPLAVTFSVLFLVCFILWRYANGCESVLTLLGSALFGLPIGGLVYLIHVYLFGRNAVNFLGVPLLADSKITTVCGKVPN